MNITDEQYSRLSRFMDADMDLAEMEAFAQELKANPAMRAQLDFEQSVRDGFAFKKEIEIAPQGVPELAHTIKPNGTPHIVPLKKRTGKKPWLALAIAASVLAAIATIVFFETKPKSQQPGIVKQKQTPATKKSDTIAIAHTTPLIKNDTFAKAPDVAALFAKNFTKDELPDSYPMYLADAFTDSDNGKETKLQHLSLSNIGDIRGDDEKQEIAELGHYYKGISFLKTGNAAAAITNLQWVLTNSKNEEQIIKAQWYMALAYLKNKEVDKSITQLKKLEGKKNDYSNKAKRLLKEVAN